MNPEALQIRAYLRGAIALPGGPLAIDALLAAAVATRDNYLPYSVERRVPPIPVYWYKEGYHAASFGFFVPELSENRWRNRRFPIPEAQWMGGPKLRRINIQAGAQKSYRLPTETMHLENDCMSWLVLGDRAEIEELLKLIGYLGKRRAVGLGKVVRWEVTAYPEHWPLGKRETLFPVLYQGVPLRPLPAHTKGVKEGNQEYRTVTYPYFEHHREQLCWTTPPVKHQQLSRLLFT